MLMCLEGLPALLVTHGYAAIYVDRFADFIGIFDSDRKRKEKHMFFF